MTIQSGSGGMVSSLGGDSIAPCEIKRYMFTCLLICMLFSIGLFESPDLTPLIFFFNLDYRLVKLHLSFSIKTLDLNY